MNYTLLLILITGFIIAALVTYLAESWRYKRFVFSLDSKPYINQLFTGYSRMVYIAGEFLISLTIILALAALFTSYYDLSGGKDTSTPLRVEHPPAKSPMKEDVVSKLQPPPGMSSSLPYTIQVGAFENSQNLDKRIQEIEHLCGMDAFIGTAQIGDTKWYRLFVGHFLTPEEARQLGQWLVRHDVIRDYLVQEKKFVQDLHSPSETEQAKMPAKIEKRKVPMSVVKHPIITPKPIKKKPVSGDKDTNLAMSGFKHRPYTIQVAAFKTMQNLNKGALEIKKSGIHNTFFGEILVNRTRWYRLFAGHFQTAKEARQFGQSLVRQKTVSTYLVKRISYTTLLGAFSSESETRKYIKNKISGDIHPYIIPPPGGSAPDHWFLAAGVFPDKKSAEDFAADLRNRGYHSAQATRK